MTALEACPQVHDGILMAEPQVNAYIRDFGVDSFVDGSRVHLRVRQLMVATRMTAKP